MEIPLKNEKKSIVIDDKLSVMGDSLEKNLVEVDLKPDGVKYLGSIERLPTGDARMVWGWSDCEFRDIYTPYLLSELEEIKYDNNLDSLLDYDSGIIIPSVLLIPCIECIRRYYNKPAYFLNTDNIEKAMIFI